jgi:predicted enzyme related to lactoylglutathione lyase
MADAVVVATGFYGTPKVPDFAGELDPLIVQMHSSEYRRPAQLRPGGILLVGAGNSGADIAMEVSPAHRTWLSGPDKGQIPVRIGTRGHRLVMPLLWFLATRMLTVRTPIGRKLRPHVLEGGAPRIRVKSDDLKAASVELVPRTVGVRDGLPLLEDGDVLDVENVIWCTGFRHDFDWIDAPVLDTANEPVHEGGVAVAPGLNFLGLDFQYSFASENVGGVRYDAKRIAQQSRGARLGGLSFREGFPIFHTADLERAVRFYVELIGCEEVFRYEDAYVGLTGPVTLGLTAVQELEPAGRVTLWLYCDDADAEIERLRAAGVEVAREPEDREWGERAGSVLDPDGNEVWIAAQ